MSAVATWDRPRELRRRRGGPPLGSPRCGRTDRPAASGSLVQHRPMAVAGLRSRHLSTSAPALRVTARGRLATSLCAFGVVAFAVLGWRDQPVTPVGSRTVVVDQGQSLTDIAQRELPAVAVAEAIARIRYANQMNATDLRPGQRLVVPGVP